MEDKIPSTQKEKLGAPAATKWQTWLKRFGLAGFLFFLIKGLVWIGIFVGMGKCIAQ